MAEELGLEQAVRQCGAIDGYEGMAPARSCPVQRTGDHLFSGSRFARNQDGGAATANQVNDLQDPAHFRGVSDQQTVIACARGQHDGTKDQSAEPAGSLEIRAKEFGGRGR